MPIPLDQWREVAPNLSPSPHGDTGLSACEPSGRVRFPGYVSLISDTIGQEPAIAVQNRRSCDK